MRKLTALLSVVAIILSLHVLSPAACRAQDSTASAKANTQDAADFGEAADPIAALRGMKDKTLVFVFDVSGSMRDGGNLQRARAVTVNILREGVGPGDHVALLTFGAGNRKVFDTTVQSRADLPSLIDQVPNATEAGAGTNIREPHHEALKIVDAGLPHRGVIVLLTDSFNDEPKTEDPTYASYLKYYTPGGHLTKYPKTRDNRDYESLLRELLRSGKLTQFGIGIKIAPDGRPIERLPQAAPPPVEAPEEPPAAAAPVPAAQKSQNPLLYLWLLLAAGIIALLAAVLKPLMATTALRITGGPTGAKDFAIKSGQTVRLGGDGAAAAFDAYSLPAAREPVALIRGARGQLVLVPAVLAAKAPAVVAAGNGSNQSAGSRVYHNGLVLERDAPLHYGDEVRVSVQAGETAAPKEYRLRFEDPRKTF